MIETLVVVAVIAVLIAIAVPALSSARQSAWRNEQLANHQTIAAAVSMYATSWDEHVPYMAVPGEPVERDPRLANARTPWPEYFGWQGTFFYVPLLADGSLTTEVLPVRSNPSEPQDEPTLSQPRWTPFVLSHAFAADPAFWDVGPTPNRPEWLRGVRLSCVLHPSGKVMLGNLDFSDEGGRLPANGAWSVTTCDGASRFVPIERSGVSRGLGAFPFRGATTRDGVRGIDVD